MAEDQYCAKYQMGMGSVAKSMTSHDLYLFDDVFGKEEFRYYYSEDGKHADCAADFILNEDADLNARVIAALSIQKIPQDQLFPILDKIVQAAIEGKLNLQKSGIFEYSILMAALFPRPNFNAYLDFYYDDPRSKSLLAKAKRIPNIEPAFQKRLDEAQSGQGREEHFDLLDIGQNVREDYRVDGRSVSVYDLIGGK